MGTPLIVEVLEVYKGRYRKYPAQWSTMGMAVEALPRTVSSRLDLQRLPHATGSMYVQY